MQSQPEDATYEEIMRELACERMIEQGLADSRYRTEVEGEIRISLYGHYRIAYLLRTSSSIDILGVFHDALASSVVGRHEEQA